MSAPAPRFFLDQDQSGHWYLVPEPLREEWTRWTALSEDDEASWTPPEGAHALGGSPSCITFTDPDPA